MPDYAVPALDKALDILELLADQNGALSQSAIADAVDRSVGEIFRVLQTLEKRGYLLRDPASGLYSLSMRTFELAHRHPPLRGLVQAALAPMRALSESTRQSCNLSVLDAGRVRVIAQIESPADFGFRVRVGAEFDVSATATGIALAAFAEPSVRASIAVTPELSAALVNAAALGYVEAADSLQPGIIDLVVPVFGHRGAVLAALTVPYVATTFSGHDHAEVRERTQAAARSISSALDGAS